jgi:hypothetical protein
MTNDLPTVDLMLSLVRQSYRSSMGDFSYETFINRLWKGLDTIGAAGVNKVPEQERWQHNHQIYDYDGSSHELKAVAIEAYSKIIRTGFVSEQPNQNFGVNRPTGQWFRWTARGLAWIDDAQAIPEDPSAYMHYLRENAGKLDPVVEQYVRDALVAFDRGADFAAAVMVGAACEKLLYLLAEAMLEALAAPTERTKLGKLFESRKITAVADLLREKVDASKLIPYSVREGSGAYWSAMIEAIRQQRNDAVHPMNAKASRDSVRLSLAALPAVVQGAEKLREWLQQNRVSI